MILYVARHARTNYNDAGLYNSDPAVDVHLTSIGLEQAANLARKLKHARIDQIFVSELERTQQTADVVNKYHDAQVTIDARLNDTDSGYEGKPGLEYFAALDKADDKWSVRFNGGESFEDTRKRVQRFLDELKTKNYDSVLIVTSMFIVQAIYGLLKRLSYQEAWDFEVDNAHCIELEL